MTTTTTNLKATATTAKIMLEAYKASKASDCKASFSAIKASKELKEVVNAFAFTFILGDKLACDTQERINGLKKSIDAHTAIIDSVAENSSDYTLIASSHKATIESLEEELEAIISFKEMINASIREENKAINDYLDSFSKCYPLYLSKDTVGAVDTLQKVFKDIFETAVPLKTCTFIIASIGYLSRKGIKEDFQKPYGYTTFRKKLAIAICDAFMLSDSLSFKNIQKKAFGKAKAYQNEVATKLHIELKELDARLAEEKAKRDAQKEASKQSKGKVKESLTLEERAREAYEKESNKYYELSETEKKAKEAEEKRKEESLQKALEKQKQQQNKEASKN